MKKEGAKHLPFSNYTMRGSIYEELNHGRLRVLVVEANTMHTRLPRINLLYMEIMSKSCQNSKKNRKKYRIKNENEMKKK